MDEITVDEITKETAKDKEKPKEIMLERDGKTYIIVEYFVGDKTYIDIVKNALRREFERD